MAIDPILSSAVRTRVEYVFVHPDTEKIRKLQTKIKLLERERDMWRNLAFAKR